MGGNRRVIMANNDCPHSGHGHMVEGLAFTDYRSYVLIIDYGGDL